MNLQCHWKKWSSLLPCWHKHSRSLLATGHFDCQREGWYDPSSPRPQMLFPTSSPEPSTAFVQLCRELGQERWKWHGEGRTAHFGCSADLCWIKMAALPEPGWTKWENWFRLQLISLSLFPPLCAAWTAVSVQWRRWGGPAVSAQELQCKSRGQRWIALMFLILP